MYSVLVYGDVSKMLTVHVLEMDAEQLLFILIIGNDVIFTLLPNVWLTVRNLIPNIF